MALRKKYQEDAAFASPSQEEAPPTAEASAMEAPQPAEQSETKPSPAEEAAKSAIKERLAETERATTLTPPQPQQPQYADDPQRPLTPEEIIEKSGLPESAQRWLRQHPEYISNPAKNNEIIALHNTARRQAGGSEFTDLYFKKMETLLGIRPEEPQPHPQANGSQQVRQQQPYREPYRGPPVSAAPTREVPSFSGRPMNYRAPLTADEREIALSTRPDPGMTNEQAFRLYEQNKERARHVTQERGNG